MNFTELSKTKLVEGKTYFIKKGIYKDVNLTLGGSGKKNLEITIEGGNGVVLEGETNIKIKGKYLTLRGMIFNNCGGNKLINLDGDFTRLTNCEINGMANDMEQFVRVKGRYCRIDNNKFSNFDKVGVIVCFVHSKNRPSFCMLDNNTFNNRKPVKDVNNGLEMVRIGDSKTSLSSSKVLVYNNYFNNCNGEIEIISVKGCDNLILQNNISNCEGGICLRHGKNNKVVYNFITGDFSSENYGGIRICDTDHLIYGNTIDRIITTNPFRSPISLMCGQLKNKLNGYAPVENIKILENDIIECYYGFALGVDNKSKSNIKPNNITIKNNRIVKCRGFFLENEKVLGYEDSILMDNDILKTDVRLRLKPGKKIKNIDIEDYLFEVLKYDYTGEKLDPIELGEKEEDEEKEDEEETNKEASIENGDSVATPPTPTNTTEELIIIDDDELIPISPMIPPPREDLFGDIYNIVVVIKEFREVLREYKKVENKKNELIDKMLKLLN